MGENVLARGVSRRRFLAGTAAVTLGGAAITMMGARMDPRSCAGSCRRRTPARRTPCVGLAVLDRWQPVADRGESRRQSPRRHDEDARRPRLDVDVRCASVRRHRSPAAREPCTALRIARRAVPRLVRRERHRPATRSRYGGGRLCRGGAQPHARPRGRRRFWLGSAADAARYGNELRARAGFGRVDISIDPAPGGSTSCR